MLQKEEEVCVVYVRALSLFLVVLTFLACGGFNGLETVTSWVSLSSMR